MAAGDSTAGRATLQALFGEWRRRKLAWRPQPGPQSLAYACTADVLLYGGAAGGGKTDLMLGKAHTQHRRSLILRREFPQLKGIRERAKELFRPLGTYSAKEKEWRVVVGGVERSIEFGSCQHEDDREKYQGRPHDLLGLDEAAHFLESQVTYLSGWIRSEFPDQRCQLLLTSNPPTDATGDWLLVWFAPWLDPKHPRPAKPGELRWFAIVDGKSVEVADGAPFAHKGETITPQTRTFIPARVTDNVYYARSGYVARLQALPEPLRSKMLDGDFTAGREDATNQVIPTEWVRLAQERWRARPRPTTPMSAMGVDVARGGKDETVLTPRYDNWIGEQIREPGRATPDGDATAQLVMAHRRDRAAVNIDVIGVGSSPYDALRRLLADAAEKAADEERRRNPGKSVTRERLEDLVVAMNGSEGSAKRDRSGQLGFANQRAEWWWGAREALDPKTGADLALPPDPQLLADLCAPTWKLTPRGILVEAKEDVIARIGRSPDRGDSCVYAIAIKHQPGTGILDWMRHLAAAQPPKP